MAGYFSFRKQITGYFVRIIYALGFIVLTVGGIGFAVWASLRLYHATLPTRTGVYFIAAGLGVALIGNLAWRMICEFWLLLFNMHAQLVSLVSNARGVRHESDQPEVTVREVPVKTNRETVIPEPSTYPVTSGRSVLGLS